MPWLMPLIEGGEREPTIRGPIDWIRLGLKEEGGRGRREEGVPKIDAHCVEEERGPMF